MGEQRSVTCPECQAKLRIAADSTARRLRCVKCDAIFSAPPLPATLVVAPPPTPAGWYADPHGAPTQRYFDGRVWTDQLAPLTSSASAAAGDSLSTKSAAVAGLLQLFLGWFGLGRFYLGYGGLGVTQLVLGLAGLIGTMMCFVGLIILVPLSLWVVIEGILMIAGKVPDSEGRQLR